MGVYVTASEVTAEGATASVARIDNRILKWEAIVEQLTGNIFRKVSPGALVFDGNDARLMHFNLPIVAVNSIKINGQTTALDSTEYRAYTGNAPPQDHRRNPKIELTPLRSSIYATFNSVFVRGLDQVIDADWGFVDPGDVTPPAIKAAIIQLVMYDLDDYFAQSSGGGSSTAVASKRREKTDGHEIEWQQTEAVAVTWSMLPADVSDILALYRRPIRIASPMAHRFLPHVLLGATIYSE